MKIFIYKLYCKDKNIKPFYIGSTKNIKKRIEYHNISSVKGIFKTMAHKTLRTLDSIVNGME